MNTSSAYHRGQSVSPLRISSFPSRLGLPNSENSLKNDILRPTNSLMSVREEYCVRTAPHRPSTTHDCGRLGSYEWTAGPPSERESTAFEEERRERRESRSGVRRACAESAASAAAEGLLRPSPGGRRRPTIGQQSRNVGRARGRDRMGREIAGREKNLTRSWARRLCRSRCAITLFTVPGRPY